MKEPLFMIFLFLHTVFFSSLFFPSILILNADAIINAQYTDFKSFCAGEFHACTIFNAYAFLCWGPASSIGTTVDYGATPSTIGSNIPLSAFGYASTRREVTCISSGYCVLFSGDTIKCAGTNDYGQAGVGLSITPIGAPSYIGDSLPTVNLGSGIRVSKVVGGYQHVCVATTESKAKCFGRNNYGQLGYGDSINRGVSSSEMGVNLTYINLGANVAITSIHSSSSANHNCAVLSAPTASAQRIKCWGLNDQYQLGYGDTNNRGDAIYEMGDNLTMVDLGTESKAQQLALGGFHTCVLRVDNVLKCFGRANEGQLGSGSTATISSTGNSMPSVQIDSGLSVKFLSAGKYHTCVVFGDLVNMKCVGLNHKGQLGQGDTVNRGSSSDTIIPLITSIDLGKDSITITSIYSGASFNCVIFQDGRGKCFGDNGTGQLGIGSTIVVGDNQGEMGKNLEYIELVSPTKTPTVPTKKPTLSPSRSPSSPTHSPTSKPSGNPTALPTQSPSMNPTLNPSLSPSRVPSLSPSLGPLRNQPSQKPTSLPTQICSYDKSKLCKKDLKCEWKKDDGKSFCVLFDCTLLDKRACKKEKKRCMIDKNSNSCILKI